MDVLGLDIGGANIKWADARGGVGSEPFALWREPAGLAGRLARLCARDDVRTVAVTMTAELCDCFETRAAGVAHVLDAVEAAAAQRTVHVWSTQGRFIGADLARQRAHDVAAANWHALATAVARHIAPHADALVDVGSTTSDVIPLADGACAARGRTDTQRLATGELVYLGVERTPLMALAQAIELRGEHFGVMAEHFATMADAMMLAGLAPLRPDPTTTTADGRPMTQRHAAARVLRMIGADTDTHSVHDAAVLAQQFVEAARARLSDAICRVIDHIPTANVLVSGSGESFATRAVMAALPTATIIRLSDIICRDASAAACACALIQLWNAPCAVSVSMPNNDPQRTS